MHAPRPGEPYAHGWVVLDTDQERILMHDGSNDLFFALVLIRPDRGSAVMVATNAGGPRAEMGVWAAANRLESIAAADSR